MLVGPTLSPCLLTLPRFGHHSSPAPLQWPHCVSCSQAFSLLQIHPPPHSTGHRSLFKTKFNNQVLVVPIHIMSCCVHVWNAILIHYIFFPPPLKLIPGMNSRKPLLTIDPFLCISSPPSQSGGCSSLFPQASCLYYWICNTVLWFSTSIYEFSLVEWELLGQGQIRLENSFFFFLSSEPRTY